MVISISRRIQSQFTRALLSSTGIHLIRAAHHRHYKKIHQSESLALFLDVSDPASHFAISLLPLLIQEISLPIYVYLVPPPKPDVVNDVVLYQRYKLLDVNLMAAYYGRSDWSLKGQLNSAQIANFHSALIDCHDAAQFSQQALPLSRNMWRQDVHSEGDVRFAASNTGVASQLEKNGLLQRRLGHYLGAMIYFRGEWFSVLDRLQHLYFRLKQYGYVKHQSCPLAATDTPSLPTVDSNQLDFFFSFRSPYSYLAVSQIEDWAKRYDLAIRVRPVLPMVMRGVPLPRVKQLYIITDCLREAALKKIPFGPFCDPLGKGVERCLKIFPLAEQQQLSFKFIKEISQGIWSQGLDVSHDRDLSKLVTRVGLDWQQALDFEAQSDLEAQTEANGAALNHAGLWGVPSFKLGELAIWGQDRIDLLETVMRISKLQKSVAQREPK